jgi:hypothetical protein
MSTTIYKWLGSKPCPRCGTTPGNYHQIDCPVTVIYPDFTFDDYCERILKPMAEQMEIKMKRHEALEKIAKVWPNEYIANIDLLNALEALGLVKFDVEQIKQSFKDQIIYAINQTSGDKTRSEFHRGWELYEILNILVLGNIDYTGEDILKYLNEAGYYIVRMDGGLHKGICPTCSAELMKGQIDVID